MEIRDTSLATNLTTVRIPVQVSYIPEVTVKKSVNKEDEEAPTIIPLQYSNFKYSLLSKIFQHSTKKIDIFFLCKFRQKRLIKSLQSKCAIPVNPINPIHEQLLRDYWALSYPDNPEINSVSSYWKLLGFSGENPHNDFIFGGLVALQHMVYFAEHYRGIFRKILGESQRYPSDGLSSNALNMKKTISTLSSSFFCSQNTSALTTPCNRTPKSYGNKIWSSSPSLLSTPKRIETEEMRKSNIQSYPLVLPRISESASSHSNAIECEDIETREIPVSYPLSIALISISIMVCLYLRLLPCTYKIPGLANKVAPSKVLRNFSKLYTDCSKNILAELFSVCAIRMHSEWVDIIKYLGPEIAVREFDKALRNVQAAMISNLESLPKDILELRTICNMQRYL
ncbi:ELMO CED-12 family protein [Cryptosporidium andersoni]|uniref:ELMO CED-12 family protein n=1 Tax=Cryptosporidium andersoni TaxID=117008 RepID=A0A1J4MWM5_9CRYT|nr:ELMO CED-12 family protein [Cryptosporidium andersoni]